MEALVTKFFEKNLLRWFEALSLLQCLPDGVGNVARLESLIVSLP
jgi:hypothetical protein